MHISPTLAALLFSVLFGSQAGDMTTHTNLSHPFTPCPESPNCIIYSTTYEVDPELLYQISLDAVHSLSPFSVEPDSQSLQIKAVFRIALFGFKDDVIIAIHSVEDSKTEFHIKSASRVGYSDLGVNRRRVQRIMKQINRNF